MKEKSLLISQPEIIDGHKLFCLFLFRYGKMVVAAVGKRERGKWGRGQGLPVFMASRRVERWMLRPATTTTTENHTGLNDPLPDPTISGGRVATLMFFI